MKFSSSLSFLAAVAAPMIRFSMVMAAAVLLAAATVLLMVGVSQSGPTGEVAYASGPGDDRATA